jgi:DGQHR domain-containing protein
MEHCQAITEYLVTQDNYVLPPLSLCVEKMIRCHILQSSSAVKMGVAVLPTSILYNITDGQHRCRAIQYALTSKVNLGDDGIGVTIVVEHDLSNVHQNFYDCAQNKSIPQSLLTVYNGRDHLARLVRDICKEVPIFTGRIEQVSKTVGRSAINIFTLNQLRTGVAELLTGYSSQGNISLRKEMAQRLDSDQAFSEHKKRVVEFFNGFTSANREWSHILASGEPALGVVDTSEMRQRYVSFTGTGLIVLGRVGYSIRNLSQYERERLIDALAKKIEQRGFDLCRHQKNTQTRLRDKQYIAPDAKGELNRHRLHSQQVQPIVDGRKCEIKLLICSTRSLRRWKSTTTNAQRPGRNPSG